MAAAWQQRRQRVRPCGRCREAGGVPRPRERVTCERRSQPANAWQASAAPARVPGAHPCSVLTAPAHWPATAGRGRRAAREHASLAHGLLPEITAHLRLHKRGCAHGHRVLARVPGAHRSARRARRAVVARLISRRAEAPSGCIGRPRANRQRRGSCST